METIFEIFNTFGWPGIVALIFCTLLLFGIQLMSKKLSNNVETGLETIGGKLSEQISKQNDVLTEQLSKQNDNLTSVIITQEDKLINYLITEKKNEHERHNKMIEEKEDLAVDINNYLTVINNVNEAQRTYVLEFHNHNENLSGTPFVKFTCKYEWYDRKKHPQYIPLLGSFSDVSFAAIAQVFKDVRTSENHCVLYNDLEEFGDKNPSLYYYLVKDSTQSLIFKGLYDKNNILIAVIVIEYDHKVNKKDINFNKLNNQAAEITQLINLRYKYVE